MVSSKPSFIHLEGKVAVITGASRGIGEAIALAFVQSGAKVVLASRKRDGLDAAAGRIREALGEETAERMAVVPAHAGHPDQLEALVGSAIQRFGGLDVVVNNAATNPYFGPMVNVDDGAYEKTFQVNAKGYFEMSRIAARHWVNQEKRGGTIINVASVVALAGAPLQGVYAMTKAAVVSMTQTLAVELGPSGIRVNAIAPGLVDTKFASAIVQNSDIAGPVVARTPLRRFGEPAEIAGAALYLASDAASFVTGHTLVADGGLTISGF
ncbi:MAG: glucose 1-dehydrogenase [Myxococcota bacterium]